jgi:hypothetical protein
LATESVILTVLPTGWTDDRERLKATIFVSPRLSTDGEPSLPLSEFGAFANWPKAVAGMRFGFRFDGMGTVESMPDPNSQPPDPELWALVFDAGKVSVIAGKDQFTDMADRTVRSFPASNVAKSILGLYKDVAQASPTGFPAVTTGPVGKFAGNIGAIQTGREDAYKQLDALISREHGQSGGRDRQGRVIPSETVAGQSPGAGEFLSFLQVNRFYDRPGARDPLGPERVPDPPRVPEIDFHGYVAFLGDYPKLLRPLGLAIDVVLQAPENLKGDGRVRLEVESGDFSFVKEETARPWTNYTVSKGDARFLPRSRTPEHPDVEGGAVRLQDPRKFALHQIDVDGSAIKAIDFAANMLRLAQHLNKQAHDGAPSMTPDQASLPALRTGGFLVTRENRAEMVVGQFDQAAQHELDHKNGNPANLFAEDVNRGYRLDVQNVSTGRWYSLCERDGSYLVRDPGGDVPIEIPPDEGYVKGSSTTSVPKEHSPGPGEPDLYLHEALFGWDGWSLVTQRPGQEIPETGAPPDKPLPEFPLVTKFEATPGTLPRLRFAETYRFRARTVDLAGNSVPPDLLMPGFTTDEVTFLRYEPVPSPAVVPLRQFTEGESLMRMVIRSTLDEAPELYVELDRVKELTGHDTPATAYLAGNERHLAPPKTSVQLAEWHKAFEPAFGVNAPKSEIDGSFDVAAMESGSFLSPQPGAFVVNPDPGQTPTDLNNLPKGEPLKQGEYVCHGTDPELPYLPDLASRGPSFTTLPGDVGTRIHPEWRGAWPGRKPMRIRIQDGGKTGDPQKAPDWDEPSGLLTVFLRQAEMVTVRLSSAPEAGFEGYMGIWDLLDGPTKSAQRAGAASGRHWMLTPSQGLTLVHAVEKPLAPPSVNVTDEGVTRNKGETFAVLGGTVGNHARSTGRLDIEAVWEEPVDDPANDQGPSTMAGRGHVADFLLEAVENSCRIGRNDAAPTPFSSAVHKVRHEFGDTKHRWVDYAAIATTRFREYFPPEITSRPELITHAGEATRLSVPSSRRPDPPEVLYVVPTFSWEDEPVGGLPIGVPFAELPANVLRAIDKLPTAARRVVAREPHRILEFVPDFKFLRSHRRVRKAGLRVYLDRPWYSSGADELLAVVVPDQPYLLWSMDLLKGLQTDVTDRTNADRFAERIIRSGGIKATGVAGLSASERLFEGIKKIGPAEGMVLPAAQEFKLGKAQIGALSDAIAQAFPPAGDPEQFVTRWGRDPIWGSDAPHSGPWIHQFPLRHRVGTGLSLSELPGHKVAAVGHLPRYDTKRGLWYCDVDIEAGNSYFPMVRLALARYQPYSIPGVHLSRVVVPEWIQLVPERTATVSEASGGRVRITLKGPGGYTAMAKDWMGDSAAEAPGMSFSRVAYAQLEILPQGSTSDLAWVSIGKPQRLTLDMPDAYSVVRFDGHLTLPVIKQGDEVRISIREYEKLLTDFGDPDEWTDPEEAKGGEGVQVMASVPSQRHRLVYAEFLPLP